MVEKADQEEFIALFEEARGNIFALIDAFLRQHDEFGFMLVAQKSKPSIELILKHLRTLGQILNMINAKTDLATSETRQLLNARQQVFLFERAALALQTNDHNEYTEAIHQLRQQANF